ncbi:hypothetical protein PG985_012030 [Apiospora marii]|uniref:Trihydrophobin n=1 Tax=Apiospora marii TaxID=335849 RepID=A0ABR1REF5_9PEZI
MKLSIIPSLLLATLASACVQEGRACAAGGDKCCLRRSCVSSTKGSSLGFCVSIDADSLLAQPMATVVPAAPAPAPAPPAAAPAMGGQPSNGDNGGMMGEPNGNNGNGQAPPMGGNMNGAQPANMNGPGMFPVSGGGQGPTGVNQANTGNADPPFYIVPTEK